MLPCFSSGRVRAAHKRLANFHLSVPESLKFSLYGPCRSEPVDAPHDWPMDVVRDYSRFIAELATCHGRAVLLDGELLSEAPDPRTALRSLPTDSADLVLLLRPEDAQATHSALDESICSLVAASGANMVLSASACTEQTLGGFTDGWLLSCNSVRYCAQARTLLVILNLTLVTLVSGLPCC